MTHAIPPPSTIGFGSGTNKKKAGAKWILQDGISSIKKGVSAKKQRACFKNAHIKTYEIVQVVNEAWKWSFARVEYNKKAIVVRGWYPLTRNLLDHPENEATSAVSNNQQSVAGSLNYQSGIANTVISDMLQNLDREVVQEQIRMNQDQDNRL
jgi:hypothetical protein